MKSNKSPQLFLIFITAMVGFIIGCGEKVAGTSTTTGNTISGVVTDTNQIPLPGIMVTLRSAAYRPSFMGIQIFKNDSQYVTTTDSMGRYKFTVANETSFFLEATGQSNSNQTLIAWADSINLEQTGGTIKVDTLQLLLSTIITGEIRDTVNNLTTAAYWVGFPGTNQYTRLDSTGKFRLEKIATGVHKLEILRINPSQTDSLDIFKANVTITSDSLHKLDEAVLPTESDGMLQISACPELRDVITAGSHQYNTSPLHLYRTLLQSSPPEILELDLCYGTWRSIVTLPDTLGIIDIYLSGQSYDLIPQPGEKRAFKVFHDLDSLELQALPQPMEFASSWGNHFYSWSGSGERVFQYESINQFLQGQETRELVTPPQSTKLMAAWKYFLFFFRKSNPARISIFDLNQNSFHEPVPLEQTGDLNVVGMAGGEKSVWLLNSNGNLLQYNLKDGIRDIEITIQAPGELRFLDQVSYE